MTLTSSALLILQLTGQLAPASQLQPPIVVNGDFNGDGAVDTATLRVASSRLLLRIQRGGSNPGPAQDLTFGIDPTMQAAICALPATLEVRPAGCGPDDEPLPGCKPLPEASDLILSGGDCDAISLYWNHDTDEMDWWRL